MFFIECDLIILLVCISLIINDVEHLFISLLAVWLSVYKCLVQIFFFGDCGELHCVACRILVPGPLSEPVPPAVEMWILQPLDRQGSSLFKSFDSVFRNFWFYCIFRILHLLCKSFIRNMCYDNITASLWPFLSFWWDSPYHFLLFWFMLWKNYFF